MEEIQSIFASVGNDLTKSNDITEKLFGVILVEMSKGAEPSISDQIELLGKLVSPPKARELHGAYYLSFSFTHSAKAYGKEFIVRWLKNLREAICSARPTKGKKYIAGGAVSSIAATVCHRVGLQGSMAIGVAAVILNILTSEAHKAFCDITDEEVVSQIEATLKKNHEVRDTVAIAAEGIASQKIPDSPVRKSKPKAKTPKKPKATRKHAKNKNSKKAVDDKADNEPRN